LIQDCTNAGGNLVDETYNKMVDYVVCPIALEPNFSIPVKYKQLVTDEWLKKSLCENELAETQYYFKPFEILSEKDQVLKGENVGI
jgi:hypothetical protein